MVGIVTGLGLGLHRNSSSVLGAYGQIGSSATGQAGGRVTVNAATGNLIVQSQDQFLLGMGPDSSVTSTYNSQNPAADDWQRNFQRHVTLNGASENAAGSTVTRYGADGRAIVYTLNGSYYVGREDDGIVDKLTYSSATELWTWVDGKTNQVDIYYRDGRLKESLDADGNKLTYEYTNGLVTKIKSSDDDYTLLTYMTSGSKFLLETVTSVYGLKKPGETVAASKTQTRVKYIYDASDRLSSIEVDLTPENVNDAEKYTTTYTYDSSGRISTISQTDGTFLTVEYDASSRVSKILTKPSGNTVSTTEFTYASSQTAIKDSQGGVTTMVFNANNQLTRLVSPPPLPGEAPVVQVFAYDSNGNLTYSGPTSDPLFGGLAQNWGDLNTSNIGTDVTTTETVDVVNGVRVYHRKTNSNATAEGTIRLAQSQPAWTSVAIGQTVQYSAYIASSGVRVAKLYVFWRSGSGGYLGQTSPIELASGGNFASGTAVFAGGTVTVPSDLNGTPAYAQFVVQGFAAGNAPVDVSIAQPSIVVAGKVPAPAYAYTYDDNGNLAMRSDVQGNRMVYYYNSANRLLTQTVYNGSDLLVSRYVYDGEGHLTYAIAPDGEVTKYTYNTAGQQTAVIQYAGKVGESDYANYKYTPPANSDTTFSPDDATMNTWSLNKPKVIREDMTYDERGALRTTMRYSQIDSTGAGVGTTAHTTTYIYDGGGQLLERRHSTGGTAEFFLHDGLGRIRSFTDHNQKTTQTSYAVDAATGGSKAVVTLANNTVQTSVYDRTGALVSQTTTGGSLTAETAYVYDSNGNLVRKSITTGSGQVLSSYYFYDDLNRKVADISADGAVTAYRYNSAGQLVAAIAYATKLGAGSLTKLNSVSRDAATSAVAAIGIADVTPLSSPDDRWSWSIYDAAGRLVEIVDSQGAVVAYAYDGASRLVSTTAYYNLVDVTNFKTTIPGTPVLPTAYAGKDRVTRHYYDGEGRLVGVLDSGGYLTVSLYDRAGQKAKTIAYATQVTTTSLATQPSVATSGDDIHNWFFYDARGILRATIDGEGRVTQYDNHIVDYNGVAYAGRIFRGGTLTVTSLITTTPTLSEVQAVYPTNPIPAWVEVSEYAYDKYGRVASMTAKLEGGVKEETTYGYDSVYNLVSEVTRRTDGTDRRVKSVKYDSLGRVDAILRGEGVEALELLGATPTAAAVKAVWDAYGTTYAYNAAGQVISETTLITADDTNGNRKLYYYDTNGRLAYEVNAAGGVVKFSYDAFGYRIGVSTYDKVLTSSTLATMSGGAIVSALNTLDNDAAAGKGHFATRYDSLGRQKATLSAAGAVALAALGASPTQAQIDAVWSQYGTNYSYSAFGEVVEQIAPLTTTSTTKTTYAYSKRGLLMTSTADVTGVAVKASYDYDAFGRLTLSKDTSDNIVSQTSYYRDGQVKTQTDALNNITAFSYDALGRVLKIKDSNLKETNYAYSLFGRQITVTDRNNIVTVTTNNTYGQTLTIRDAADPTGVNEVTYVYDADGNVETETRSAGAGTETTLLTNVTTRAYNEGGDLVTLTSPRGIVTTYAYKDGNLISETQPTTGAKTSWTYDGKGRILEVKDAYGIVTKHEYDLDGRKVKTTVNSGGLNLATLWSYDLGGRNLTVTDPSGKVVKYSYDGMGRLTDEQVDPTGLNLTTHYEYDSHGNLKSKTDAANKVYRYVYDANDRLIYALDELNSVTAYKYDNEGRTIRTVKYSAFYAQTDEPTKTVMDAWILTNTVNNLTVRSVYDDGGRLAYTIDATGGITGYGYDHDGHVVRTVRYAALYAGTDTPNLTYLSGLSLTDAVVTRHVYDMADFLVYSIDERGVVTGFTNDKEGRVTQQVEYAGRIAGTDRSVKTLTNMTDWLATPANATVLRTTRQAYDALGRLVFTIDSAGALTGYNYDKESRLTQTVEYAIAYTSTGPKTQAQLLSWVRTQDSNNVYVNQVGARTTNHFYDAAGRKVFTQSPAGVITRYVYANGNNNVTQQIEFNVVPAAAVDTFDELLDWANSTVIANDTANRTIGYTYDNAGRLTKVVNPRGRSTSNEYDNLGRILAVSEANEAGTLIVKTTYAYNAVDWLEKQTTAQNDSAVSLVTDYTYDTFGRQKTVTVDAATFNISTSNSYDAKGNLTSRTDAEGNVVRYAYDDKNRLAYTIEQVSVVAANNTYDAAVTAYSYDATGNLLQTVRHTVLKTSTAGEAAIETFNQMKDWAALIANNSINDVKTRSVYDANGRLAFAINANGAVISYVYDGEDRVVQTIRYAVKYSDAVNFTLTDLQSWASSNAANALSDWRAYDVFGRDAYAIDATGAVVGYTYDIAGRLSGKTAFSVLRVASAPETLAELKDWEVGKAAAARVTTYTYDVFGRLVTQTVDPNGLNLATAYTYDKNGNLLSVTDAEDRVVRYVYDIMDQQVYAIDGTGAVTASVYDKQGRVTRTLQFADLYTATGDRTQSELDAWIVGKTATARIIWHIYDRVGRESFTIDAGGAVTGYLYDNNGHITRKTEYKVLRSTTSLPSRYTLQQWSGANSTGARSINYTYDQAGRLTHTKDASNVTTRNFYNALGRITTISEAYGDENYEVKYRYTYDGNGNLTKEIDADFDDGITGNDLTDVKGTYQFQYDVFGRRTKALSGIGSVKLAALGPNPSQTSVDAVWAAWGVTYKYDAAGRILETEKDVGAEGTTAIAKTINHYNAFGELDKVTDPNGNSGYFYYDKAGRQTMQVDAAGYATVTTYNDVGETASVRRYKTTTSGATIDNKPTVSTSVEDNITSFTYDAAGRLKTSTDANENTKPLVTDRKSTQYGYNAFGDRVSMINTLDAEVTYTYNSRGLMETQMTPQTTVTMSNNTTVVVAAAITTRYEYDTFGNLKTLFEDAKLVNSAWVAPRKTTYEYDVNDRLTQQSLEKVFISAVGETGEVTEVATQKYAYDKRGNQVGFEDANGKVTATYYDRQDRKVAQVDALGGLTTFIYDDNDNLVSQRVFDTAVAAPTLAAISAELNLASYTSKGRETRYVYDKGGRQIESRVSEIDRAFIVVDQQSILTTKVSDVEYSKFSATVTGITSDASLGILGGTENGGVWTARRGALVSRSTYDLNGNVLIQSNEVLEYLSNGVIEKEGAGKSIHTYYDALGRKTGQVDQENYVTKYELDHEGNVTTQTQYDAKVNGTPPTGGTVPTPATNAAKDRTTTFEYDRKGQRKSEERTGILRQAGATLDTDNVTTSVTAKVQYEYNSLGFITKKIEATGDITAYQYDALGRLAVVRTAVGKANELETLTTYDGLGNVVKTIAAYGKTEAQETEFAYGSDGRLNWKEDALDFRTYYTYDKKGQVVQESYTRKTSGGTPIEEGTKTTYDGLGQVITSEKVTKSNGTWGSVVANDTFYNAYGEVTARSVRSSATTRSLTVAQEFADYDAGGRVWRSNFDDGVTKIYGYDANGNLTMQAQSLGTTDLRTTTLSDAVSDAGTVKTYRLYSGRNELIEVRKPVSSNIDGTVSSSGVVAGIATGTVTITQNHDSGTYSNTSGTNYAIDTVTITLSNPEMTNTSGGSTIFVEILAPDGQSESRTFSAGTTNAGTYELEFPNAFESTWANPPTIDQYTVKVYQKKPDNTEIFLAIADFTSAGGNAPDQVSTNVSEVGSTIAIMGVNPTATTLKMYVRPWGSPSGTAYTEVTATRMSDGLFHYNAAQPPFSGTPSSHWEVRYNARDGASQIVEAKAGKVSLGAAALDPRTNGALAPKVTAETFESVTSTSISYASTKQEYNAFGDMITQTDARNNKTTYSYSVFGNLTAKIAAEVSWYNDAGVDQNLSTTSLADNPTEYYYHDQSGRLIGYRNANGHLTRQDLLAGTGYGGAEALITDHYNPDGSGTIENEYDIFGNVKERKDGEGKKTFYAYDKANRLIEVKHADRGTGAVYTSGGVTQLIDYYSYDELGQRIRYRNNLFGTNVSETTDYDIFGRIIKTDSFTGQTTTHVYAWTNGSATRVSAGKGDGGYWKKTTTLENGKESWSDEDIFGKALKSEDYGDYVTTFTYNLAGFLTDQDSNLGTVNKQSIDYSYTVNGEIAGIKDNITGNRSVYAYDKNGNRIVEATFQVPTTTGGKAQSFGNAVMTYDALNRVTSVNDALADITYTYDGNGNRRRMVSTFTVPGQAAQTQDYWYKYDKMDRFTITKGVRVQSGSTHEIVTGDIGISFEYNARGERMKATFGDDGHVETYDYTADGYLQMVSTGANASALRLGVSRTTDVLGRLTTYNEYKEFEVDAEGKPVFQLQRVMMYDADSRVTFETDTTKTKDGSTETTTVNNIGNNYYIYDEVTEQNIDQGVLVSSLSTQTQSGSMSTTNVTTSYSYIWRNGAKVLQVSAYRTTTGIDPTTGLSTHTYDDNGNLTEVNDSTYGRVIEYKTDVFGQVLFRQEFKYGLAGAQRRFFYVNGRAIGDVGSDALTSDIDYAEQLATSRSATGTEPPLVQTPVVGFTGDFDASYQAYNPTTVSQSGSSYTVTGGETLQSIALSVWGDASLWYLIADANGLSFGADLTTGQSLIIPGGVYNAHNGRGVYKPYDSEDLLGNTAPTLRKQVQPPSPKRREGCGLMGTIIAVVVAAVVVYVTRNVQIASNILKGAFMMGAADVAYQGTQIIAGNQSKFNWKQLGAAAITGGILGGANLMAATTGVKEAVIQGLKANTVRQRVNQAFGLQKKFDWTALAVAGFTAGVSKGVGKWADSNHLTLETKTILTGTASALAGATAKTLLTRQSFGKSLGEVMPDAIGSTIGDLITGGLEADAIAAAQAKLKLGIADLKGKLSALSGTIPVEQRSFESLMPRRWKSTPDTVKSEAVNLDELNIKFKIKAGRSPESAGQGSDILVETEGDLAGYSVTNHRTYNLSQADGLSTLQELNQGYNPVTTTEGHYVNEKSLLTLAVKGDKKSYASFDLRKDKDLIRVFVDPDTNTVKTALRPHPDSVGQFDDLFIRWQPALHTAMPQDMNYLVGRTALNATLPSYKGENIVTPERWEFGRVSAQAPVGKAYRDLKQQRLVTEAAAAEGDPIGKFLVHKKTQAAFQVVGGGIEMGTAVVLGITGVVTTEVGVGWGLLAAGAAVGIHGKDTWDTGIKNWNSEEHHPTGTALFIQRTFGVSQNTAELADLGVGAVFTAPLAAVRSPLIAPRAAALLRSPVLVDGVGFAKTADLTENLPLTGVNFGVVTSRPSLPGLYALKAAPSELARAGEWLRSIEVTTEGFGSLGGNLRIRIGNKAAETTAPKVFADGSFSVTDWTGYPDFLPKPSGPMNLLETGSDELISAQRLKAVKNDELREAFGLRGVDMDIHELQPVKFGGSPTDLDNKLLIPRTLHNKVVTPFWNGLANDLKPYVYRAPKSGS